MRPSGIGMFLTIAVGISVLAGWMYVCYPSTATEVTTDARISFSWLVLAGFALVAVMACTLAAQLLHHLLTLLRSVVQLAVVAALVIGVAMLWRNHAVETAPQPSQVSPGVVIPDQVTDEKHAPVASKDFWWEQSQGE